jgi:hypothetical protein
MQPQLQSIIESIESAETRELVAGVFNDLNRLLGYLDSVRALARSGGTADESHFILEAIRCEALAAAGGLDYFCACLETPTGLSEELERISFAVRHELRAVFDRVLPGVHGAEEGMDALARLTEAHDLLRNCFEQSTISLARLFHKGMDDAALFDDIRVRRENSLRLYEDLQALLRSARYAEWHEDPEAIALFSRRLELFSAESTRHLMDKDRETFQTFIEGMPSVRTKMAARLHLHRFTCYLEILLKHVGMRSVLAEASLSVAA